MTNLLNLTHTTPSPCVSRLPVEYLIHIIYSCLRDPLTSAPANRMPNPLFSQREGAGTCQTQQSRQRQAGRSTSSRDDKSDQAPAPNPHRSTPPSSRSRELPRGFLPRGFSDACRRAPLAPVPGRHPKTLNDTRPSRDDDRPAQTALLADVKQGPCRTNGPTPFRNTSRQCRRYWCGTYRTT
jgi:hypothetical protein